MSAICTHLQVLQDARRKGDAEWRPEPPTAGFLLLSLPLLFQTVQFGLLLSLLYTLFFVSIKLKDIKKGG